MRDGNTAIIWLRLNVSMNLVHSSNKLAVINFFDEVAWSETDRQTPETEAVVR
jgi:hypothetical protein